MFPSIHGVIRRRLLINYRVDPEPSAGATRDETVKECTF
jgi:hypothetical protein